MRPNTEYEVQLQKQQEGGPFSGTALFGKG